MSGSYNGYNNDHSRNHRSEDKRHRQRYYDTLDVDREIKKERRSPSSSSSSGRRSDEYNRKERRSDRDSHHRSHSPGRHHDRDGRYSRDRDRDCHSSRYYHRNHHDRDHRHRDDNRSSSRSDSHSRQDRSPSRNGHENKNDDSRRQSGSKRKRSKSRSPIPNVRVKLEPGLLESEVCANAQQPPSPNIVDFNTNSNGSDKTVHRYTEETHNGEADNIEPVIRLTSFENILEAEAEDDQESESASNDTGAVDLNNFSGSIPVASTSTESQPRVVVKSEPTPMDDDEDENANLPVINESNDNNVKNYEDVANEAQQKAHVDRDPSPKPSTSKSANLSAFFDFDSEQLPKVKLAKVVESDDLGVPKPRLDKKAYYKNHSKEDESKYVDEHKGKEKPLPHVKDDSDSEDDEAAFAPRNRYFQRIDVYKNFNFCKRPIDTSRLAVFGAKEKILKAIENNRVVIVEGFTGCGKTTQVPQFILDKCFENNQSCNIIVTQPRRIAAISVARRVCHERGWNVGTVVGYHVGRDFKLDGRNTLVTYATTGVLLQKLISQKTLKEYSHIIIDEVHERDLESDELLLIIKKILQDDIYGKQRYVKLILMSATLDASKFSKYFTSHRTEHEINDAPIIKIPHSFRHKIEDIYLDQLITDTQKLAKIEADLTQADEAVLVDTVYDVAVQTIVQLDTIEKQACPDPRLREKRDVQLMERGSVLVFLPGMDEIKAMTRALNEEIKENLQCKRPDHNWIILPMHSSITDEEQAKVFEQSEKYQRKIILSTNIAESSVTVPDIVYVLDFCLSKSLCIDEDTNFTTLRLVWASKSQCIQRRGRTGRVADGKVYRLVPKKFYFNLENDIAPEMLRSNLETVVLQLKKFQLGCPKSLLAMALDPPPISGIERAVANLKELGALTLTMIDPETGERTYDTCDGDITFMGEIMTDLPIPQQCSRLIMLGYCFGVLKDSIIIAAGLSSKNPFSSPMHRQLDAYLSKLSWGRRSYSDLFAILFLYKHWTARYAESGSTQDRRSSQAEKSWAKGAFVQLSVLREMRSTIELIQDRIKRKGIDPHVNQYCSNTDDTEITKEEGLLLKIAIAGAFYPNYFHRTRPRSQHLHEKEQFKLVNGNDLFRTVFFKGFPIDHDGSLYAKHISDYLSHGLSVPAIKFDGQKVFAIFDQRGEKIGPVSRGLYRAVKRRLMRDPLEFPVTYRENEKQVKEMWNMRRDRRRFTKCPPQVELPPIHVEEVALIVTHHDSPSQFFAIYASNKRKVDGLTQLIDEEFVDIPLPRSKIFPNSFCLAPFTDSSNFTRYYRAKILITNPIGEALVYFVDFGNSLWMSTSQLKDFPPSLAAKGVTKEPGYAVECRLALIKPAVVHGSIWHIEAINKLKNFCDSMAYLRMKIYSVSKSVIIGHLEGKLTENGSIYELNSYLLKKNFADEFVEPMHSEQNHQTRLRFKCVEFEKDECIAHNLEQVAPELDYDFIDPPEDAKCMVSLKGPFSPLEISFQALCRSSNIKQVSIDNHSVNSVVLDHEPTCASSRLLIASQIAIHSRTGNMSARNTTIMPAIPGLASLLAMIFSPTMELRTDADISYYTGVLCGLGTSPQEPDMPIYPDHDLEIVFDTEFSDKDINLVNKLRYMMNLILRQSGSVNSSLFHKEVVNFLFQLLKTPRESIKEEIYPQEEYVWNRIGPEMLVTPSRNVFDYRPGDIFQPHKTVKLNQGGNSDSLLWSWEG